MTAIVATDPEGAVKNWINAGAVAALAGRAWFGIPTGSPTMPLVTIARVGGGPQAYGLLEDVLLVLDVWAKSKLVASDNTRALTDALYNAEGVALDAGTWCHGVISISTVWLPDPVAELARYSLTVAMTVEAQ